VNQIEPAFEKLAVQAGCKIKKHGHLPREAFLRLLGSMDCNIQGGFTESFGLTFCESYRMGVPCLTTPGVKVLPDYPLTQVDDPDNIVAIAEKISVLIKNPGHIEGVNRRLDELDTKNKAIIESVLENLCASST
jgi:glycosyltransferase involved in cell wall biosynthesis